MNETSGQLALLASYPKSGNTWVRIFIECYLKQRPSDQLLNSIDIPLFESGQAFTRNTGVPLRESNLNENWPTHVQAQISRNKIYKTHLARATTGTINLIPTFARVVHIVRDPRSMIRSYANHFGVSDYIAANALIDDNRTLRVKDKSMSGDSAYVDDQLLLGSWRTHTLSWLAHPGPRVTIRYEDMIADPERAFALVLQQLKIPYVERRFRFALGQTTFNKLQAAEQKVGFRESSDRARDRFFRSGGKNSENVSNSLRKKITVHAGDVLAHLKYI